MDFSQFFAGVLATVIGFGLTLGGQAFFEWKKNIKSAKQCLRSIITELERIKDDDISNIVPSDPNMFIRTPVWDGISDAYRINMLKDKSQEKNKKKLWYTHLFEMYNLIKEFNKWSAIYTDKYFSLYFKDIKSFSKEELLKLAESLNKDISDENAYENFKKELTHNKVIEELNIFHQYLGYIKEEITYGNGTVLGLSDLIDELKKVAGE